MYTPSKAQKEIEDFISHDLMYSSYMMENIRENAVRVDRPSDCASILKKMWLAGKPLRTNLDKKEKYENGLISSFKEMSNHKKMIATTTLKDLSEKYIVNTLKVHHFLTFLLYPFSLESKTTYFNHIEVSLDDILESRISMTKLLKNKNIIKIFDTSEIAALRDFNYLRNSLAHSTDFASFILMTEGYYDSIMELLREIDDIFVWAALKGSLSDRINKNLDFIEQVSEIEESFLVEETKNYPFS